MTTALRPARWSIAAMLNLLPPSYRCLVVQRKGEDDGNATAVRHGRDRGRAGRAFGRLPPQAARAVVRDPRRRRPHRRQLAEAVGLAAPVLAGAPRRTAGHAVPRAVD